MTIHIKKYEHDFSLEKFQAMFNAGKPKKDLDEDAVYELKLYIENDETLYNRQIVPIIKNIQKKMKSGKYDHKKAPKLWLYLVDNGAKKYVKEYGGTVRDIFPKAEREQVARELADEYRDEIKAQGGEMF